MLQGTYILSEYVEDNAIPLLISLIPKIIRLLSGSFTPKEPFIKNGVSYSEIDTLLLINIFLKFIKLFSSFKENAAKSKFFFLPGKKLFACHFQSTTTFFFLVMNLLRLHS